MNFLVPRPGKVTERRRSSSSPSMAVMVPMPYSGWRTLRPMRGSPAPGRLAEERLKPELPTDRSEDERPEEDERLADAGEEKREPYWERSGGPPRTRRRNS